jgi:heme-degrading monooxygenase HmoA
MFLRIWQYRPRPGAEREFETLYGPAGAWARLFARAPGYLGTEFSAVPASLGEYQTVDRWVSAAAWEAFRQDKAAAYEDLDRRCESLCEAEWLVGEYVEGSGVK